MSDLKTQYQAAVEHWNKAGLKVVAFLCPECEEAIVTPAAPKGETWDSLANCPHCNVLYMKVTTHDTADGYIPGEHKKEH